MKNTIKVQTMKNTIQVQAKWYNCTSYREGKLVQVPERIGKTQIAVRTEGGVFGIRRWMEDGVSMMWNTRRGHDDLLKLEVLDVSFDVQWLGHASCLKCLDNWLDGFLEMDNGAINEEFALIRTALGLDKPKYWSY